MRKIIKAYIHSLKYSGRKFIKWIILGCLTGLFVGFVSSVFAHCLNIATGLREEHPNILFLLPLGGIVIVYLYKTFHYEKNKGTDAVIDNLNHEVNVPLRMSFLIFVSTVITMMFGGSVGREGAALQIGGSLGSQIGNWFKFNKRDKKIVLMCGMTAAFSALFGTPVAAVFFAMEVASVGTMYYVGLVPCICASLIAYKMADYMYVEAEHFPAIANIKLDHIIGAKVVLLGICCALLSILFCILLQKGAKLYGKYIKDMYWRIVIGGCLVIVLTFLVGSRDYLGTGMHVIEQALEGNVVPYAFILKMLFTVVTITAGYKGGEIVPSFFIGATFGCIFGQIVGLPAPFSASLGMIAVFCGVTNCPISSMLIGFELFGYTNVYYLLIVIGISYMLSGNYSLYHAQRIVYSKFEYK